MNKLIMMKDHDNASEQNAQSFSWGKRGGSLIQGAIRLTIPILEVLQLEIDSYNIRESEWKCNSLLHYLIFIN